MYACVQMPRSSPDEAPGTPDRHPRAGVDLTCTRCGGTIHLDRAGQGRKCPKCREKLGKIAQLEQLLAIWFEPRRWRADLVRPSVAYLVERLWTANGQGESLYEGVSPKHTNYDVFRHLVTRVIIQGIDEGWANLKFPEDPFAEDPRYELRIVDSEQFARRVESLFPEVDWDEPISPPPTLLSPEAAAAGSPKRKSKKR
jgi:hypothetical protein